MKAVLLLLCLGEVAGFFPELFGPPRTQSRALAYAKNAILAKQCVTVADEDEQTVKAALETAPFERRWAIRVLTGSPRTRTRAYAYAFKAINDRRANANCEQVPFGRYSAEIAAPLPLGAAAA